VMCAAHDCLPTACDACAVELSTILPMSPLWPPCAISTFVPPQTSEEAAAIKTWLYSLADGQAFACRGRDYELNSMLDALKGQVGDAPEAPLSPKFTDWEYGVGIKMKRAIFLLWAAKVEKHDIGSLDLISLLHMCGRTSSNPPISLPPPTACPAKPTVVILCHGFSPELGPSYPLLIILRQFLSAHGYTVIQPDFTHTYAYGAARGRSERVCIVLEYLLHARSRYPDHSVVLVGHSQGGAAAAQACRRSVVPDGRVRGLVMLGSESARERIKPPEWSQSNAEEDAGGSEPAPIDIYHHAPPGLESSQILMLHSARDAVISRHAIQQLVR
jgi:hypothetical protein